MAKKATKQSKGSSSKGKAKDSQKTTATVPWTKADLDQALFTLVNKAARDLLAQEGLDFSAGMASSLKNDIEDFANEAIEKAIKANKRELKAAVEAELYKRIERLGKLAVDRFIGDVEHGSL